jgi:capsular exopolysaccharide synthesis family protein
VTDDLNRPGTPRNEKPSDRGGATERGGAGIAPGIGEQLRLVVAIARRNVLIGLICVVVVPIGAYVWAKNKDATYEATTTVVLNRQNVADQVNGVQGLGSSPQSFQQILVTQTQIARTPTVVEGAISAAGAAARGLSRTEFLGRSTVRVGRSTDLLRFSVRADTVPAAKRLSVAYGRAYLDYRVSLDTQGLRAAITDAQRAVASARAQGTRGRELTATLTSRLNQLQSRAALQSANAQIVAGPADADQVAPRPKRDAFFGFVLGILLAIAIAVLRYVFDTKVSSAEQVEGILEVPTLAHIDLPREATTGETGVLMLSPGQSVAAESFRLLRANITFGLQTHRVKVLMVTSALPGEGKSTTIANLAVAFALSGKRVALVDLDLRRPTAGERFGLPQGAGLTSVVVGDAPFEEALRKIDLPATGRGVDPGELYVLPSGPCPPDPSEFVSGEAVETLFERLRSEFDLVLVDAPPLVGVSDATIASRMIDAAVACVRVGFADRVTLTELGRALQRAEILTLGVAVLGRSSANRGGAYYYSSVYATASNAAAKDAESAVGEGSSKDGTPPKINA